MESLERELKNLTRRPVRKGDAGRERFEARLEEALAALDGQEPSRRPRNPEGFPGGLVFLDPELPTLVLPDLHTRRELLWGFLDRPSPASARRFLDALAAGELQMVCIGDALHSEGSGAPLRWRTAWGEYLRDYDPSPVMDREMNRALALLEMIFLLQAAFPENFFFLKGNHENIACEEGRGNHPFGKYAAEGEMVLGWLERRWGLEVLRRHYRWEHSLPFMVQGPWFLVSHSEPRRAYTPEELIDVHRRPEIAEGLTWTRRGQGEINAAARTLSCFLPPWSHPRALYWAGHTIVEDIVHFEEEQLVLFHDCRRLQGLLLPPAPREGLNRRII